MAMVFTGQMGRQWLACSFPALRCRLFRRLLFGRCFPQCAIPQQVQLIRIEGLCTAAKLAALQLGNNQVESLDLALLREGVGLELGGIFGQWLRR